MQIRLKIALVAVAFVLAAAPAFAVEMPTDGSKNFSTPAVAPSYFANEAVPESARVANPATFTREDVAAAPDVGQDSAVVAEPERHGKHAYAHKSSRHASGRSKGHGATGDAKSASSKATRTAAVHSTARSTQSAGGSASTVKPASKTATTAGAGKAGPTKHAKTSTRQHVEAIPAGVSPLVWI